MNEKDRIFAKAIAIERKLQSVERQRDRLAEALRFALSQMELVKDSKPLAWGHALSTARAALAELEKV